MRSFFKPNLDRTGRMVRGVVGGLCLVAGTIVGGDYLWWAGVILVAAGFFSLFEAIRGWCLLRACGLRTKA
ncbi:MAG: DUF2892 domain-containing protein [Verrucomicrobia bacterium]|nr:DUF2892 domain-containing protein [Verrucomicrobiota bacterium]MDE3099257.1 DUF2892 domain-containing protein [Verrucomicrobiota bacterium]